MRLVPFSPQHLGLNEPLPFGLRDEASRLPLSAATCIDTAERLDALRKQALSSSGSESAEWHLRVVAASGTPLVEPALRDTLDRRYGVKGAVSIQMLKAHPTHERLLAMR